MLIITYYALHNTLYQTSPYLDFARPRVNRTKSTLQSAQQVSGSMEKSDLSDKHVLRLQTPSSTSDTKPDSHLNSLSLQSDLPVLLVPPLLMTPLQSRNKS